MKTNFIALITDFGEKDPFVGIMKSVIYSINKSVKIIDLTHYIPPQDIKTAAFYLMTSIIYLPKNALVICVVDPEVGTGRSVIWAKTEKHQVISPDNGVISWVNEKERIIEVRSITNQKLFLEKISSTFHGRDIMAPAAAYISKGFDEEKIGPIFDKYTKIAFPYPKRTGNNLYGEIIAIDHFGNALTNIPKEFISPNSIFHIANTLIKGLTYTYALAPDNEPVAIIGSYDFLEFSLKNGNFSSTYNIKPGDKIEVIINI
jgi:S-adenosylmethionine hydrolase